MTCRGQFLKAIIALLFTSQVAIKTLSVVLDRLANAVHDLAVGIWLLSAGCVPHGCFPSSLRMLPKPHICSLPACAQCPKSAGSGFAIVNYVRRHYRGIGGGALAWLQLARHATQNCERLLKEKITSRFLKKQMKIV